MLGRAGPFLSHLFFTDDLVLFGKASMDNALVMKDVLKTFCHYSGHKVNANKSNIFFSSNTDASLKITIGNTLGFHVTEDLGKT